MPPDSVLHTEPFDLEAEWARREAALLRRLGFRPDGLADIDSFRMDEARVAARRHTLNCSELGIVARGDPEQVNKLAKVKWGEEEAPSLAGILNVFMGNFMEPALLSWFERAYDAPVSRRGERVTARRRPWLSCTLDGWCSYRGGRFVIQTKFLNPLTRSDDAVDTYTPQCLGEAICTDADGTLLVVYSQREALDVRVIEPDPVACGELLSLADGFWEAVRAKRLPNAVPAKAPRGRAPSALRAGEVEMAGNGDWYRAAEQWLDHREPAAKFDAAAAELKALLPDGVKRAFGHGVEVSANRAGSKSVKAHNADSQEANTQ